MAFMTAQILVRLEALLETEWVEVRFVYGDIDKYSATADKI